MQNTTFNTYYDVTNAIDAARKARKTWDTGARATSNEELHKLLAAAFEIFQACIAEPDLSGGITDLLKQFKLKHSKKHIARAENRAPRVCRRSYTRHSQVRFQSYARVLAFAHADSQTPAALSQYIQEKGGIDEIRRTKSGKSGELQAQQFVTVAQKRFAKTEQPGLFDVFKPPPQLKPANGNRYSLALIRDNKDGTGSIVHGLDTNSLVEKALEEVGNRAWERRMLPLPASAIASEILYLTASKPTEAPLKTKDLHLALGYSEARTSEILRSLVQDGWIIAVPCGADRRVRWLRATCRTLEALRALRTSDLLADLHRAFIRDSDPTAIGINGSHDISHDLQPQTGKGIPHGKRS